MLTFVSTVESLATRNEYLAKHNYKYNPHHLTLPLTLPTPLETPRLSEPFLALRTSLSPQILRYIQVEDEL